MRARQQVNAVIASGLVVAAFTLSSAREAHAQAASGGAYPAACADTSVPPTESARAHTIYQGGKVQYDDKNYDAAIVQFRDAYRRDCSKHDLLIIISRAYELKGDKVEALRALETFVERVPNSPDLMTHKNGIESLKKQIAAQPPPPPPPVAAAPVAPPPEVREHTIPPWIVVGVGGATAVAGVVLLVAKPDTGCNLETQTCTRKPDETDDAFAKRQSDAGTERAWGIAGPILLVGGLTIAAGGLLWHFLEPTGPVEKTAYLKPKLTPQVAPGFAGMSLGGSF